MFVMKILRMKSKNITVFEVDNKMLVFNISFFDSRRPYMILSFK